MVGCTSLGVAGNVIEDCVMSIPLHDPHLTVRSHTWLVHSGDSASDRRYTWKLLPRNSANGRPVHRLSVRRCRRKHLPCSSLCTIVCRHKRAFLHKVHDFRLIRSGARTRLVTGPATQQAKPPQLRRKHGRKSRVGTAVLIWAGPRCWSSPGEHPQKLGAPERKSPQCT